MTAFLFHPSALLIVKLTTQAYFSKDRKGDASYKDQSPHAEPVSPSRKNIPIIAIIASRPLASSAASFFSFSAGSLDVSTLNPKSPFEAGVPGDWSCESSQKAP